MAKQTPPPGTVDLFPIETRVWRRLENTAVDVFERYGYGEIRTPIFEYTEVFQRGIGSETDVVRKEMYTFEDRGGRSLTLRPEGTAGVMRALAGTDVISGGEAKVYYLGPMFRGERPAAGRKRQFHQIGVENAGRRHYDIDAECVAMLAHYLDEIGVKNYRVLLNTRGDAADRKAASALLTEFFSDHVDAMCDDCRERLRRNVWRILDCKNEKCGDIVEAAPDFLAAFSSESMDYFHGARARLDELGVSYQIDPKLVRGLDYYVDTVFEVVHSGLGGQDALAGGGRYELSIPGVKKPLIGVGFAAGVERLLMACEASGANEVPERDGTVFLVGIGAEAKSANMALTSRLRRNGIRALMEMEDKSVKAQMRAANRMNVDVVLIRGDREIDEGIVVWKDMASGEQSEIDENEAVSRALNAVKTMKRVNCEESGELQTQ